MLPHDWSWAWRRRARRKWWRWRWWARARGGRWWRWDCASGNLSRIDGVAAGGRGAVQLWVTEFVSRVPRPSGAPEHQDNPAPTRRCQDTRSDTRVSRVRVRVEVDGAESYYTGFKCSEAQAMQQAEAASSPHFAQQPLHPNNRDVRMCVVGRTNAFTNAIAQSRTRGLIWFSTAVLLYAIRARKTGPHRR